MWTVDKPETEMAVGQPVACATILRGKGAESAMATKALTRLTT
jgi:hypothetical protein